jgi:hypothetical protein
VRERELLDIPHARVPIVVRGPDLFETIRQAIVRLAGGSAALSPKVHREDDTDGDGNERK